MASLPTYQYTPLSDARTSIRLLKLFEGVNQDHIHGTIQVYGIEEAPPFDAISYVWGTKSPTDFIVADSARLAVSPHLKTGLRNIQAVFSPEWVWIDAICIQQADEV